MRPCKVKSLIKIALLHDLAACYIYFAGVRNAKKQWSGNNKCITALEFHHVDPSGKDFALSGDGQTRSWEIIKIEIDKCILVCANCHREIHDSLINKEKPVERVMTKINKSCLTCNKDFVVGATDSDKQFCSQECYKFSIRKVKERPTKEKLLEELKTTSYIQLGKKYGVSDNAIRKWLK